MQSLKEYWQKLSNKTKKMLVAIVVGTAAIAIVGVLALKYFEQRDFSTLFTGLNQEEAKEVVALLQEESITYRYDNRNGTVRVPSASVDQTRVELLSKGYPKSGFSYDIYRNNSGLMTTESDKEQYELYDLQDRLGATIRLFDGVQDAKVTIVDAGKQTYALSDESATEASASVTVTMQNGVSLTEKQAAAIKRLISTSVRGMNFTRVSVFDADTMIEVGGTEDATGSAAYTELTDQVEESIAGNVRRVLEKLYGQGTVAVSVKGTLNTEKLIQESTQYSTPEKIDENDKTGLLEKEDAANENSQATGQGAGNVAGADANADTPRYTNEDDEGNAAEGYGSSSTSREWLYNIVKEQRQIDPGVLQDTTIAIVIDTDDTAISERNLKELVADAAGISRQDANTKISIIRALSAESKALQQASTEPAVEIDNNKLPIPLIIAMVAVGVLLLLLLFLLLRKRRKKAAQAGEGAVTAAQEEYPEDGAPKEPKTEAAKQLQGLEEEMEQNEEILNLRMQHSLRLKQNIGEFIEQNPQIAAKLMQSWLRGEEDAGGSNRSKVK
ncbi:MAG: flagellar M-ring protein FliF [Lachnospiraceae bacterium]